MSQITGESPSHSGAFGFGFTNPHEPERSTPYTTRPRPSADSAVPTRSSFTSFSAGASTILLARTRMTTTISTSPANTHRHDAYVVNRPPMSGPTATAIAPADATNPYARGRSARAKLLATSATIAGRMSTAPSPSRIDHPINNTGRLGEIAVVNDPQP